MTLDDLQSKVIDACFNGHADHQVKILHDGVEYEVLEVVSEKDRVLIRTSEQIKDVPLPPIARPTQSISPFTRPQRSI